jgi:hypothetical protein
MPQVVSYLMEAEQMHVVVEPSMYEEAAAAGLCMERLFTFTPEESGRSAEGWLQPGTHHSTHNHRAAAASTLI